MAQDPRLGGAGEGLVTTAGWGGRGIFHHRDSFLLLAPESSGCTQVGSQHVVEEGGGCLGANRRGSDSGIGGQRPFR